MTRRLLTGDRGAEVWRGPDGTSVHVLDPVADAALLHGWVTRPGAEFFGLGQMSVDDLRETYEFVDSLPTHHAYLVRVAGEPVALVQLYHPEDDPLATAYDVAPGDVGVHFFRGSEAVGWADLGPTLLAFGFAAPGALRLVAEPDVRNRAAVARMAAFGFAAAGEVHFESPHGPKDAVLAFLPRAAASTGRVSGSGAPSSSRVPARRAG